MWYAVEPEPSPNFFVGYGSFGGIGEPSFGFFDITPILF